MSGDPIPVTVRRYQCPHCTLRRARRSAAVEHIGRCWKNPDNRTCLTCANYESVPDGPWCFPDRYCDCDAGWTLCRADVELPDSDGFPVTGCALWKQLPSATEKDHSYPRSPAGDKSQPGESSQDMT